jgi:transcriptional regulator with XRE-family HTH domain
MNNEGLSEADGACRAAMTNDLLAARIKELRQARRISQASLADGMMRRGFPWRQQTVTRIEGARQPVRADELAGIAAILGVLPGDLFAGASADRAALLERTLREQIAAEILSGARDTGDAA